MMRPGLLEGGLTSFLGVVGSGRVIFGRSRRHNDWVLALKGRQLVELLLHVVEGCYLDLVRVLLLSETRSERAKTRQHSPLNTSFSYIIEL